MRGRVEISSHRLECMHGVASNKDRGSVSKYAKNGFSKARLKSALRTPKCECRCRVPLRSLLRVCIAFWMLTKGGQDTVLWTIQQEYPGSKKDWYIEGLQGCAQLMIDNISTLGLEKKSVYPEHIEHILHAGHHVCKVAWMYLIGVGKKRLSRCKDTCYGKDGRSTFGRYLVTFDFVLNLIHLYYSQCGIQIKSWPRVTSLRTDRQTSSPSGLSAGIPTAYVLVSCRTHDKRVTVLQEFI